MVAIGLHHLGDRWMSSRLRAVAGKDFSYFNVQRIELDLPKMILTCEVAPSERSHWPYVGLVNLAYEQGHSGLMVPGQHPALVKLEDAIHAAFGTSVLQIGHIIFAGTWTVVVASSKPLPSEVTVKVGLLAKKQTYPVDATQNWAWVD